MNRGLIKGLETGASPYSGDWQVTSLKSVVGITSITNNIFKYKTINDVLFFYLFISGTGSTTAFTAALPSLQIAPQLYNNQFATNGINNSAIADSCRVDINIDGTIQMYTTFVGGVWTASGSRIISLLNCYQIR